MFEQVGQHRQSRRRTWAPLLLTIVLNSAGFTTLVVNSGKQMVSHFQSPMPAPPIIRFAAPAPPGPPGPPGPPAAPAKPRPTPKPTVKPEPEVDPEPELAPTEPTEPAEPAEPTEAPSAAGGGGGIDGAAGGGGGGGGDCPPGQACDGDSPIPCPPGMICDGEQIFVSSADVRVKRRVAPQYPEAARSLNLPETRCIVTFSIDPKGRPAQVQIDGCPAIFHAALEDAAWKWRFYPVKDASGRPQAATFRLSTVFRLR